VQGPEFKACTRKNGKKKKENKKENNGSIF
jgi:hypothetical protein